MTSRLPSVLATALATLALVACAPESSSPEAGAAAAAAAASIALDGRAATPAQPRFQAGLPAGRTGDSIAAYPDRGDLVGYDRVRLPQHKGAHTFYPVRVSEAHALEAIGTGTLFLTGPDGRRVALKYERHVEHPSGDWSWIGRDEHGIDGILTFGEEAVFGVLPYGEGDALRLTTSAGQTWMATTAKDVLSPLQQRTRAGLTGQDYRVPRLVDEEADATASALVSSAMASAPVQRAEGAPAQRLGDGTTIDLLLGYTPGFVSMLGGASQAQTRLNHLVTVGNQAFVNSNVAVNLRLVGTLQVNYPDTGSNQNALQQLTGSTGNSSVPIPASLQPLRNARETYGADLVSLVRRFRDADHEGCGIAWLIGGGQTDITPGYERFGYSAISDSNGTQFPENGHFCRDETLVHELGHNLGSQHDQANARDEDGDLQYGRYPWSFGLKTDAAGGNFYTVMAYGESTQTAWRVFSNPQSTYCGGRACGVADQADNARSLRATAPLIAAFRSGLSSGYVHNDINGDGRSDVLFHNAATRQFSYRIMNGTSVTRTGLISGVGPGYYVATTGDFNGDGLADIVWTSAARDLFMWTGNGTTFTSVRFGDYPAGWSVVGAADVDGDGRSDVLFHNPTTRQFSYRIMNGTSVTRSGLVGGVGPGYYVAAAGDFNGDGRADIVWTSGAKDLFMWTGNGTTFTSARFGDYPTGWSVVGPGDVDGDGRSDLLFRNPVTRQFSFRIMNGTTVTRSGLISGVGAGYWVGALGDFNGDGREDPVWTSNARDLYMWTGNGTTFTSVRFGDYPSGWQTVR